MLYIFQEIDPLYESLQKPVRNFDLEYCSIPNVKVLITLWLIKINSQQTSTCSKSTTEKLEKSVKYVKS